MKRVALQPEALEASRRARLPTRWGPLVLQAFRTYSPSGDAVEHLAVLVGEPQGEGALVRLHSSCVTGDVLGSRKCDCGAQLAHALDAMAKEGRGALLYLHQEGRGVGLFHKIEAYALQDEGANTVEANEKQGLAADARDYQAAAAMLRHLGLRDVRLLTNNPAKIAALEEAGVRVAQRVPLDVGRTPENAAYLAHKRDLMGHLLS